MPSFRSHGFAMLLVAGTACKEPAPPASAQGTAPAADSAESASAEAAAESHGEAVEVRIVDRHNVEGGIEHRVSITGRRGTLFAGTDTALAAAAEANEVLTVELAMRSGSEADHAGGALLFDQETRRILAFDAWMLPADTISHGSLVGVWRVPKLAREFGENGKVMTPAVPQFAYDGKSVVVRVPGDTELRKLDARWVTGADGRDELQYRTPADEWKPLAASMLEGKARRFLLNEKDHTWPLERVRKPADADADDRALVVDRPLHAYAAAREEPRTSK